jgi:hypothetical protein
MVCEDKGVRVRIALHDDPAHLGGRSDAGQGHQGERRRGDGDGRRSEMHG